MPRRGDCSGLMQELTLDMLAAPGHEDRRATRGRDLPAMLAHKGTGTLSLGPAWPAVRTDAKLPPDLGLHGLRHSIGSQLAMAGASNVELMEALGHKQVSTTLRYIHFAEQARSTLAERAASVAMAGLKGQTEKATVTKIGKKSKNAAQ